MLVGTLTNILVKKFLGRKFIPRFAKYLIKFPDYGCCCWSWRHGSRRGTPAQASGCRGTSVSSASSASLSSARHNTRSRERKTEDDCVKNDVDSCARLPRVDWYLDFLRMRNHHAVSPTPLGGCVAPLYPC